jgi:hypothetical protein
MVKPEEVEAFCPAGETGDPGLVWVQPFREISVRTVT